MNSLNKRKLCSSPTLMSWGSGLPEKPAPFKSRFENQVEVILHQRPPVLALCWYPIC
jgi:hypothetical protein